MSTRFAKSTGNGIGASLEALFLFLIAVAGQASIAAAQSGGTFTATGSMTTLRYEHTATLLADGRVLIAGGSPGYPQVLASAELYDPSTGLFTPTGDMTTARVGHTATLLLDGRVLIAGGAGLEGKELASAELYDPSAGTFTATGNMMNTRVLHAAILLVSGKVLIAGGYGTNDGAISVPGAELYDPLTGAFAPIGGYLGNGMCDNGPLTSTLLADGRVLFTKQSPAQLYDPATGAFTFAEPDQSRIVLSYHTCHATGTLLMDGQVLLAGRQDDAGRLPNAELYDAAAGTFVSTGKMASLRDLHTLTLLPNGMVLAAGGDAVSCTRNGCAFLGSASSAELYDPSGGTFTATGNMTAPRADHTATLLKDGRVLIAGGYVAPGGIRSSLDVLASAELYHSLNVPSAPTVRILDNNTGSLNTLAVGDSFSFQVTGAPPHSLVFVSEPGWSGSVGYTDASGLFFLNGIVGSNVVGTWQQTWTIGGVAAQPSPLQFTITPKP